MIIAQLLLPGASEYERKSQQIDSGALSAEQDVSLGELGDADIIHIYAPRKIEPKDVRDLRLPYVSNARPKARLFGKTAEPTRFITPSKDTDGTYIPEAVADSYFSNRATQQPSNSTPQQPSNRATIGTYIRPTVKNTIEQTAARIQRFREDVDWLLFDKPPSAEDLRGVDVWADPASDDDDFDGFVAEAIAAGTAVVASRTPINVQRLEKGRTGILVPCHDPNEWTHAILAALFKPEFRHSKVIAARQTASKFHPRHRTRALIQLYQSILQ